MTGKLPRPSGPHPIGLRKIEYIANVKRAQAYVWYPAAPTDQPYRPYNTAAEAAAFAGAFIALGVAEQADRGRIDIATNSVEGAPVLAKSWPLVVFNHGGALDSLANFTLMEELASSGYVTASLGHAGTSAGLAWDDGSSTLIDAKVLAAMQLPEAALASFAQFLLATGPDERRRHLADFQAFDPGTLAALAEDWATDAIAFADLLLGDDPPADLLALSTALDRERLAYAGMSLGGAAAFACCQRDPRARAGINLDGTIWDFTAIDTDVPTAFLDIRADTDLSRSALEAIAGAPPSVPDQRIGHANDYHYEREERRGERTDIVRLEIAGTVHADFTDRPLTDAMARNQNDLSTCPTLLVNRLSRSFLDWILKAGAPSVFATEIESDERAIVVRPL